MTAPTVPAAQVAEVFQLLAELVSQERVERQAARIQRESAVASVIARQIAGAAAAVRVRILLAGLLGGARSRGGVTVDGLEWAAAWLRSELDREGEQP